MSDTNAQDTPDTPSTPDPLAAADRPAKKRRHLPRRISAWVCIVLASLLIPVSIISVWAIRTVTDTNQYVATMAPLARNQVIVQHLASKATDELFSTDIVEKKVTAALPAKAKPIVPAIMSELQGYVYQLALKVFESPKFGTLWDTLNRHTHDAVVNVLTGKQSPLQEKVEKGGGIVLNVSPKLNTLIDQLNSRGVTLFNPLKPILSKSEGLGVTIVSKQQVSKFSGWFNLVVKLKWIIPAIALALAALALVVAVQRRKTLLRLAIGVALVTLLVLAGLSLGRITFLNQAGGHSVNREVAGAVWDTLLRFLKTNLRWAVLASVLVALGAWLAGPARYAVWIRSTCAKGGRWVWAQAGGLTAASGRAAGESAGVRRAGAWILEHLGGLRVLGVVVAGCFLVFGGNFTGWGLLVILIVLAVYLGLLQLVAAWARRVATATATQPGAAA